MRRKKIIDLVAVYPVISIALFFTVIPVVWLGLMSLKREVEMFVYPPRILFDPTVFNYVDLMGEVEFYKYLINSLIVSGGSVVLAAVVAIPAAYSFTRLKFKAKRGLITWAIIIRTVPGLIYIIPYFVVLKFMGLLDTRLGLIIADSVFTLPLAVWLAIPFFEQVPKDLLSAAEVDGASPAQVFLRIALPVVTPGLIAVFILVFIFTWNEFVFALILTRSDAVTAPVAIAYFLGFEGQGVGWGRISAGGILMLIPVIVFAIIVRKYLVKGLLVGAVKY